MHASIYRNTRFELRLVQQGPNSFGVICSERDVPGRQVPPLEIHETAFTDTEMAQVQAVLEMLEKKFETAHEAWENDPARMHQLIADAVRSKKEADDTQNDIDAKRAELAKINARIAAAKASTP